LLFNYESLTSIIEDIVEHEYTLLRVDEGPPPGGGKYFYLRHDVDISALAAARVGEIEHFLGVVSSFYFLLGADTYNLLDPGTLRIVEKLRSYGHCVGLHIDERPCSADERTVRNTLEWFRECIAEIEPGTVVDVSIALAQFVVKTGDGSLLVSKHDPSRTSHLKVGDRLEGTDHASTLRQIVSRYPAGVADAEKEIQ
jgi:hypothetical protein